MFCCACLCCRCESIGTHVLHRRCLFSVIRKVNAIPLDDNATAMGLGVNMIGRDVLRATSVADAIRRGTPLNMATAQHINVGSALHPSVHVVSFLFSGVSDSFLFSSVECR